MSPWSGLWTSYEPRERWLIVASTKASRATSVRWNRDLRPRFREFTSSRLVSRAPIEGRQYWRVRRAMARMKHRSCNAQIRNSEVCSHLYPRPQRRGNFFNSFYVAPHPEAVQLNQTAEFYCWKYWVRSVKISFYSPWLGVARKQNPKILSKSVSTFYFLGCQNQELLVVSGLVYVAVC